MFKKGIKLPIAWHSDQTKALADLDLDINIDDTEIKTVTFYSIAYIHKTKSYGRNYTTVASDNMEFLCVLDIKEVEKMIEIGLQE